MNPSVKVLDSGYVRVEWSREVWAQFKAGAYPQPSDFFHPSWSYSPDRAILAHQLATIALREPKPQALRQ